MNTPLIEAVRDSAPQSFATPDPDIPLSQFVENFFYKVTSGSEIDEKQSAEYQSTGPKAEHETKEILLAEVGKLQKTLKALQVTLLEYETMANKCYERQVIAEKKFSQQGELLDETRTLVELALQEKKKLADKLVSLEGPSEDLSDDEVVRQTNQLYQDLQIWVEQNYGSLQQHNTLSEPGKSDQCRDERYQEDNSTGPIHVFEDLSRCVFTAILSRFIVGTGNPSTSHALRMLDEKVQQTCEYIPIGEYRWQLQILPPRRCYEFHRPKSILLNIRADYLGEGPSYIQRNWRSATSIAAFLLAKPELDSTVCQIANAIEARYSHLRIVTTPSKTQQLKGLLWRFVEFKSKIERQIPDYYFWWVVPTMTFRSQSMTCTSGTGTSGSLVELCLSPILYKLVPGDSEPTVICPALVKISTNAP